MKSFTLSEHALDAIQTRKIRIEWVRMTLNNPTRFESHPKDNTLSHALRAIPDNGNRVLRVIFSHTAEPLHVITAYFDRTMKGKL